MWLPAVAVSHALPPPPIGGGTDTNAFAEVGMLMAGDGASAVGPICTGTLIDPSFVVAAAHCIDDLNNWKSHGYHELMFWHGASVSAPDVVLNISEVIPHPDYDPLDLELIDVALFELETKSPIEPVGLDTQPMSAFRTGETATLVGFGVTQYGGDDSGAKRETDVVIVSVSSRTITTEEDGTNACSGDSGGPLLVWNKGTHLQAGVISSIDPNSGADPCLDGKTNSIRLDSVWPFLQDHIPSLPDLNEADPGGSDGGDSGGSGDEPVDTGTGDSGGDGQAHQQVGGAKSKGCGFPIRGSAVLLFSALFGVSRRSKHG